eukprot:CAMPEP_0117649266 /NCGR_PEP_ID=MMETSP0804-20121206/874_1 /TAXON_ID=1074897 /ORGANISM="Tetraselmis astigmatica, Strain CCMP880" /LENGTH=326 /DNA_ID=CAMNT_0005454979 /DNA_START=97 /DNA_END=1077 /DNA_ORIENTATION=-
MAFSNGRRETVLVTGGAGFIGSHLVTRLLDCGYAVTVLDNLSSGTAENLDMQHARLSFIEGDVRSAEDCCRAMVGAVCVFHLAAMSKVAPSLGGPEASDFCQSTNVGGTLNVLRAAYNSSLKPKVIYAASSTCYGNRQIPHCETQLPDLITPYAVSKHQGELLVQMYSRVHGLRTCSLRFFMVYGPRQPLAGAYATVNGIFLRQALAGESLTVEGAGDQTRDFIHVDDVVSALMAAMKAKAARDGQSINVGTGAAHSIAAVASIVSQEVAAVTGRPPVGVVHTAARAFDMAATQASTSLASKLLYWSAVVPFEHGLRGWVQRELGH